MPHMIAEAVRPLLPYAVLLILPLLTSCISDGSAPKPDHAASTPTSGIGAPRPDHPLRLDAGDQLRVTVFGEDRISSNVTLESDGHITLPLAGATPVAGLTPQEAARMIATRLTGQLVNPRVTVTVTAWRPVYITGEVARPGQYPWQPGLNLMSALALAGGATHRASRDSVMVQSNGKGALFSMTLSPETQVSPGDLLKVPERFF